MRNGSKVLDLPIRSSIFWDSKYVASSALINFVLDQEDRCMSVPCFYNIHTVLDSVDPNKQIDILAIIKVANETVRGDQDASFSINYLSKYLFLTTYIRVLSLR